MRATCALVRPDNITIFEASDFERFKRKWEDAFVPERIQDLPDDRLDEVARSDIQGSGPVVEAMRRLRVAIEKSNVESASYSRRMFWLSIILGLLTLVQAIAAVPTIMAWFARH